MKNIVIGSGPAGRLGSLELGKLGEDVTLIEKNHIITTSNSEYNGTIFAGDKSSKNISLIDEVIEDLSNIRWGFQKAIEIQTGIITVDEVMKEQAERNQKQTEA